MEPDKTMMLTSINFSLFNVEEDDYRLGCLVDGREGGAVWRTREGEDVVFSLDEVRELYNLLDRFVHGEKMTPVGQWPR